MTQSTGRFNANPKYDKSHEQTATESAEVLVSEMEDIGASEAEVEAFRQRLNRIRRSNHKRVLSYGASTPQGWLRAADVVLAQQEGRAESEQEEEKPANSRFNPEPTQARSCLLDCYERRGGDPARMTYPDQGSKRYYNRKCLQCHEKKARFILNCNGTGLVYCKGCGWSNKNLVGLICSCADCVDCKWQGKKLTLNMTWEEMFTLVNNTILKDNYLKHFADISWWLYKASKKHGYDPAWIPGEDQRRLGMTRSIRENYDRWWDQWTLTFHRQIGDVKKRSQYQFNFDALNGAVGELRKETRAMMSNKKQRQRQRRGGAA